MLKLNVTWSKIQQYRFVLQLADHVRVGLIRSPESENLVRHFPEANIQLLGKLDRTFEEFETIHEDSPVWYCQLRGIRLDGPFYSKAMLARVRSGPKSKKLTFRGMLHSNRRKELQPYWEHCLEISRDKVDKVWDEPYWADLAAAEFAICPTGQNPWLYRHDEAAAAFAIPAHTPEAECFLVPTPFLRIVLDRDPLVYSYDMALENYRRLLAHVAMVGERIEQVL